MAGPMRDYLKAIHSRVVVFDGGMGATLEQFDLSLEDDYKLPGRCHEALVLNRPDVIEDLHRSMVDVGAEVVETDTFQASRLKLEEWGLEDHTYEINRPEYKAAKGHWQIVDIPEKYRINTIHAALLHTGKVLLVAGSGNDAKNFRKARRARELADRLLRSGARVANVHGQHT